MLLSHPANTEMRTHLTVRMSYDECRTWPVAKVLHEGLASYSDLAIADGHILCFHEADQGGRMISGAVRARLDGVVAGVDSGDDAGRTVNEPSTGSG